jgi:uncharacterized membrane protein (DUF2068 family)
VDWSLLGCGRAGHVTYAPDEPELREQLSARTASGEAWRCLRCASFVVGEPAGTGPAQQAPVVRRGVEIRSALILRIFAVERFLRTLIFGALAFAVWHFKGAQVSIEQAFDRELPIARTLFRQLGYNVDRSKLVGLIQHALTLSSSSISLLAAGLAVYALIEAVEGTGLWLAKRWGEYFAMVVTSLGLPYEIYDMTAKITVTRVGLFAVNLALVLYLVITRRLFGVRGGKRAYEARRRSESVMDAARAAAAAKITAAGTTDTAAGTTEEATSSTDIAEAASAAPATDAAAGDAARTTNPAATSKR